MDGNENYKSTLSNDRYPSMIPMSMPRYYYILCMLHKHKIMENLTIDTSWHYNDILLWTFRFSNFVLCYVWLMMTLNVSNNSRETKLFVIIVLNDIPPYTIKNIVWFIASSMINIKMFFQCLRFSNGDLVLIKYFWGVS